MADSAPLHSLGLPVKLHIQLFGPLKAWTSSGASMLPKYKKAQAILVILAISGEAGISRKELAGLLWSRNSQMEALARLRGTLYLLRQEMKSDDCEALIESSERRIRLREGTFETDLPATGTEAVCGPFEDVATDLSGIDPELDLWLSTVRQRLSHPVAARSPLILGERTRPLVTRMAAVIGVGTFTVVGLGSHSSLTIGLVDEISTALGRIRGVVVIAGTSTTGAVAAERSIQTELGVEYIIEGTFYNQADSIRGAVKLVDVTQGMLVWSWNSKFVLDELSNPPQDIAALIVAGLEPELPLIQMRSRRDKGELNQDAYSLLLKAIASIYLLQREPFLKAGGLLMEAIALEPHFASAYSWLALWNIFLVGQGWATDSQRSIAEAGDAAEHAITLDPNDARGLAVAGHVRAFLHRRLAEAFPLYERALAINPNLPLAWHLSGVAYAYGGDLLEARRRLERCRVLAPHDPHTFFADGGLTIVEMLSGNHRAAIEVGRRVAQLHPRFSAGYKPYLAALGHLGEIEEAELVRRRLLLLEPYFNIKSFVSISPFRKQEHLNYYKAGLAFAGVPDD